MLSGHAGKAGPLLSCNLADSARKHHQSTCFTRCAPSRLAGCDGMAQHLNVCGRGAIASLGYTKQASALMLTSSELTSSFVDQCDDATPIMSRV